MLDEKELQYIAEDVVMLSRKIGYNKIMTTDFYRWIIGVLYERTGFDNFSWETSRHITRTHWDNAKRKILKDIYDTFK